MHRKAQAIKEMPMHCPSRQRRDRAQLHLSCDAYQRDVLWRLLDTETCRVLFFSCLAPKCTAKMSPHRVFPGPDQDPAAEKSDDSLLTITSSAFLSGPGACARALNVVIPNQKPIPEFLECVWN